MEELFQSNNAMISLMQKTSYSEYVWVRLVINKTMQQLLPFFLNSVLQCGVHSVAAEPDL